MQVIGVITMKKINASLNIHLTKCGYVIVIISDPD